MLKLFLAFSALSCLLASPAAPQETKGLRASPETAAPGYPNGPDGLKQLLLDILGAMRAGNNARAAVLMSSLQLPDHTAWFTQVFGPEDGTRLAAQYEKVRAEFEDRRSAQFRSVAALKEMTIHIELLENPNDLGLNDLEKAALGAMRQPVPLFKAQVRTPDSLAGVSLGYYAYVKGGFRHIYLARVFFTVLSTAPHLRIRVSEKIQEKYLIRLVMPVYPRAAKALGIHGTVRLDAVIAEDGTVRDLKPLEGDPLLTKAALEAVRQWRYRATLLDKVPAEVQTTIEVIFSLAPRR